MTNHALNRSETGSVPDETGLELVPEPVSGPVVIGRNTSEEAVLGVVKPVSEHNQPFKSDRGGNPETARKLEQVVYSTEYRSNRTGEVKARWVTSIVCAVVWFAAMLAFDVTRHGAWRVNMPGLGEFWLTSLFGMLAVTAAVVVGWLACQYRVTRRHVDRMLFDHDNGVLNVTCREVAG